MTALRESFGYLLNPRDVLFNVPLADRRVRPQVNPRPALVFRACARRGTENEPYARNLRLIKRIGHRPRYAGRFAGCVSLRGAVVRVSRQGSLFASSRH